MSKYEGLILQARQPSAPSECVLLAKGQRFTPNRNAISVWDYALDTVGDQFINAEKLPISKWAKSLGTIRTPFIVPHWDSFRDYLRVEYGLEGGKQRAAVTQGRRDLWRWSVADEYDNHCRDKYVPDYVFKHWKEHRQKSDDYLRQCSARGKDGKVITLDPDKIRANRTNYIAARMDGLPYQNDGAYHAMLTLNLPPEFHRMTHWDDANKCKLSAPRKNPSWNGLMPHEAMEELRARWKRARALWARAGLKRGAVRGCRFVEPHSDGTPHMHCIVSVTSLGKLDDVVRGIATAWYGAGEVSVERHQRSSRHGVQWQYSFTGSLKYSGTPAMLRHLVRVDVMQDAKGACRYVDVYVRKHAANGRVQCWLSINNIRQYSYFGGGMTKRVWDALGAAGMRVMSNGRDGESQFADWQLTEKMVVERGIALVALDDDDDAKAVLMDGEGEVLHTMQRYEFVRPLIEGDDDDIGCAVSVKYSDFDSDVRKAVATLRDDCTLQWLSGNGYSGDRAVYHLGSWMCPSLDDSRMAYIELDDVAIKASMRERWRGWARGLPPPLVGFS